MAAELPSGQVASWGSIVVPYVQPGTRFTKVAAGYDHGAALTSGGKVISWGGNDHGQTVPPADLRRVVDVAVGRACGLALKSDGTVVAWGDPYSPETAVPADLNHVARIAAGGDFGLALLRNGTVIGWGDDDEGQTDVPPGLNHVISVSAGWTHSVALKRDGTVVAWGDDSSGQAEVPTNLSHVVAIAAGAYHTLALKRDGTVVAWGDNSYGQLELPASLTNVVAIAAGYAHNLALRRDHSLVGWGDDSVGQLDPPAGMTSRIKAIAVGGDFSDFDPDVLEAFSVALGRDGTLTAWGDNTVAESIAPGSLKDVVSIASDWSNLGGGSVLALRNDGTLIGWGSGFYGQTHPPAGLSNVLAIATGAQHALALKNDGTVIGWGDDTYGELDVPAEATQVIAIAAGFISSFALRSDGSVVAWGDDQYSLGLLGPLTNVVAISASSSHFTAILKGGTLLERGGYSTAYQPAPPPDLSNVVAVANGLYYTLALKSDGTVIGWGDNSDPATPPDGLSNVVAIAASDSYSLALKADGTLVAWGNDIDGQTDVPAGLSGIAGVAAGGNMDGSWSLALVRPTKGSAQPAPAKIAGKTFSFTVRDDTIGFGASGSYTLSFSRSGGHFTLSANGTVIGSGTWKYSKTSNAIGRLQLDSAGFGTATAWLSFADQAEGTFFMDSPGSGGFQAGRFAIAPGPGH